MNVDKMRHQLARTAPSPLDQILAIIDRGTERISKKFLYEWLDSDGNWVPQPNSFHPFVEPITTDGAINR